MLADLARAPVPPQPQRSRGARRSPERHRAPVATAIEVARRRLRRGYRLEAAHLLDRCVQALDKDRIDDQLLTERWAYAHDRCTGNGGTTLAPDVLERVIVWITREELEAGEQALAADRPFAAARFLMAADTIDDRGTLSAFLHAMALHRAAQKSLDRADDNPAVPDDRGAAVTDPSVTAHLKRAERCFRRAVPLIHRAAGDPALRLQCDHLAATIATQLTALGQRRAATDRMAAACACLVDYDSFARHLGDQLLRTDPGDFRTSLAALGRRISDLRVRCPDTSAEARLLTTLAHGVTRMQRTLDYAA